MMRRSVEIELCFTRDATWAVSSHTFCLQGFGVYCAVRVGASLLQDVTRYSTNEWSKSVPISFLSILHDPILT